MSVPETDVLPITPYPKGSKPLRTTCFRTLFRGPHRSETLPDSSRSTKPIKSLTSGERKNSDQAHTDSKCRSRCPKRHRAATSTHQAGDVDPSAEGEHGRSQQDLA